MYSTVSLPFFLMSDLYFWYSFSAAFAATSNSFLVKLYSLKQSKFLTTVTKFFVLSIGKNGLIYFISFSNNVSTLFLITSEYEITIGQLKWLSDWLNSFLDRIRNTRIKDCIYSLFY